MLGGLSPGLFSEVPLCFWVTALHVVVLECDDVIIEQSYQRQIPNLSLSLIKSSPVFFNQHQKFNSVQYRRFLVPVL